MQISMSKCVYTANSSAHMWYDSVFGLTEKVPTLNWKMKWKVIRMYSGRKLLARIIMQTYLYVCMCIDGADTKNQLSTIQMIEYILFLRFEVFCSNILHSRMWKSPEFLLTKHGSSTLFEHRTICESLHWAMRQLGTFAQQYK